MPAPTQFKHLVLGFYRRMQDGGQSQQAAKTAVATPEMLEKDLAWWENKTDSGRSLAQVEGTSELVLDEFDQLDDVEEYSLRPSLLSETGGIRGGFDEDD